MLGGEIDVLLGIGYNRIYPEIVHTLPSGLQIMKSKFLPATPGEICCVGGPLGTVDRLVSIVGPQASMSYLAHLTSGQDTYVPRIDYFPTICPEPYKAVFKDYSESNSNKEAEKGEVPEENDGGKIKETVTEGKPGKRKNKKGKSTAEKKDLPAEETTKPVDDTASRKEPSTADNLKIEVNKLIKKSQFQLIIQVMNVFMFGILLAMMISMTTHSTADLNNTPTVRGKNTENSNMFLGKTTVRNIEPVTEEGRLKKRLKLEEDYEDPPRTMFKAKNVYSNSVNSKGHDNCSKNSEVSNLVQDPTSEFRIKNVGNKGVKRFKNKKFFVENVFKEKRFKRNVFKENKRIMKVLTMERIPDSREMKNLDSYGMFTRAHYHERRFLPEALSVERAETGRCENDPGDLPIV